MPLARAETAVVQMARGSLKEAARMTRMALQTAPDDATLYALAGALLLQAGDNKGALTAFQNAIECDPNDDLALYGQGLAYLAQGDRAAALKSFDRSEQNGGDRARLLLARRYAQWLSGAQIEIAGAGLPNAFRAAQAALEGMEAARKRQWNRAAAALEAAQAALPGEVVAQTLGLRMSFEKTRPMEAAAPRSLLAGSGLDAPRAADRALSGDVLFSPEDVTPSIAYVVYELDGHTLGLMNTPPFEFTWDTRQAANGRHTLEVILCDREGREVTRLARRLRIFNRDGPTFASLTPERLVRLRAAVWEALTLQPDRCACAYAQGTAHRTLGELPAARRSFLLAAALRPEYRDTRQQWIACGGQGQGEDALWGGLPTEKVVALTFDDGPKPGVTEPLLDILIQERVPATFFVIGRHVSAYPELTRKIADAGMELANHSYTHRNLTKLSAQTVARELNQTQAAVQRATGQTPRFMRPPGGNWNSAVAAVTRRWGLTPCMWTVDVYGSEVIGAQQVADAVLTQVRPGSIILMHNGKVSTIQALPTIIRTLRERGYSFATMDTLARRLSRAKEAERRAIQSNIPTAPRVE